MAFKNKIKDNPASPTDYYIYWLFNEIGLLAESWTLKFEMPCIDQ